MMNRRSFLRHGGIFTGGVGFLQGSALFSEDYVEAPSLLRPKGLKKGDLVGLITPGSAISRTHFERCLENIDRLGLRAKYSDKLRVRKGFLAGRDVDRLEDLHDMFRSEEVQGIICARGGYGAMRLLEGIDYGLIRSNPKVFVGFSDITALQTAFYVKSGLVSFHGPMAASEMTEESIDILRSHIFSGYRDKGLRVDRSKSDAMEGFLSPMRAHVIREGRAEGTILGGNLSVLTALIGSRYFPSFSGCIVFLEDIGEDPYRIDRMLYQWHLSGAWKGVKGVALGIFKDCDSQKEEEDYEDKASLYEVLKERLSVLGVPVLYGLPLGHVKENGTLPLGIRGVLKTDKGFFGGIERALSKD